MRIAPITVDEFLQAAAALMPEHWTDFERRRDVLGLNPNVPAYNALRDAGALIALGAFDGDELAGYCVSIITRHLHDADLLYVSNDLLFVAAAHRGGSAGGRLMHETERIAKELGARLIFWSAKPETALYGILKRHAGYAVHEVMFSRTL